MQKLCFTIYISIIVIASHEKCFPTGCYIFFVAQSFKLCFNPSADYQFLCITISRLLKCFTGTYFFNSFFRINFLGFLLCFITFNLVIFIIHCSILLIVIYHLWFMHYFIIYNFIIVTPLIQNSIVCFATNLHFRFLAFYSGKSKEKMCQWMKIC